MKDIPQIRSDRAPLVLERLVGVSRSPNQTLEIVRIDGAPAASSGYASRAHGRSSSHRTVPGYDTPPNHAA
jgi:hypothetical protein